MKRDRIAEIAELLDKTELTEDQIGEYTGENKNIKQNIQ